MQPSNTFRYDSFQILFSYVWIIFRICFVFLFSFLFLFHSRKIVRQCAKKISTGRINGRSIHQWRCTADAIETWLTLMPVSHPFIKPKANNSYSMTKIIKREIKKNKWKKKSTEMMKRNILETFENRRITYTWASMQWVGCQAFSQGKIEHNWRQYRTKKEIVTNITFEFLK